MELKKKNNKKYFIFAISFFLPILIMIAVFSKLGIGIVGNKSILAADMFSQYYGFFGKFKDILSGDGSIFYAFNKSLGGNNIGLYAYYLASPLNLLLIFIPKNILSQGMYLIYLIKIGFASLALAIYLNRMYKKDDLAIVIFSVCYSLMSYNVVYHFNIMWLDGVMLLPLIALGIEKLIKEGKCKLYIISLFLAIISNYYIAYMICIFSLLFFIYKGIIYKRLTKKSTATFIGSSILAAGLGAFLIIPVALSLRTGKAGFNLFSDGFKFTQGIISTLSKLEIGSYTSEQIISGPANIYCGVIISVLVIIYFCSNQKTLKEKISTAVFMILLLLSFMINILEILWHGFNYPVGFEYRNSFVFCFLAIAIAYEAWLNIKAIKIKDIFMVLAIAIIFSVIFISKKYDYLSYKKVAITLAFAIAYLLIIYIAKRNIVKEKMISSICLIAVIGEFIANSYLVIINNDYAPIVYSDQYIKLMEPIVNDIKSRSDNFYRIERSFYNTQNDDMLLNYNGLTHSSSVNENNTKNIINDFGYKTASTCEKYNEGSTIPIDSILGIRYILSIDNVKKYSLYKYIENGYYNSIAKYGEFTLYENPYALPIAFMVNDRLDSVEKNDEENLFQYNSTVINSMVNEGVDLYNKLDLWSISLDNVISKDQDGEILFEKIDTQEEGYINITLKAKDNNPVYLFIKSDVYENAIRKTLQNSIKGNTIEIFSNKDVEYAQFTGSDYNIQFVGNYTYGEDVKLKIRLVNNSVSIKEVQAYSCDMNKFQGVYNNLSKNIIENTEYKDGYVKGNIDVPADKTLMYTSIPYDEGWKLKVDGKDYEYKKILNGFIGVELAEGQHEVEFKYELPGFNAGCLISAFSVLIIAGILITNRCRKKTMKSCFTYVKKW